MLLIFSENIKKVYAVQLFHRNCFSPQLSLLKSHLEQLGIDQTFLIFAISNHYYACTTKKNADNNLVCTHSAIKISLFVYGNFCLYQRFLKNKKMVGTTKTTELSQ